MEKFLFERLDLDVEIGTSDGGTWYSEKHDAVAVWTRYKCDADLCHELIHAKNQTFLAVGHRLHARNDEHEAYFTGWLFKKAKKLC